MKVVHVEWSDPCFAQSGWMTRADFEAWLARGLARSDSVGLLAFEDDEYIVLLQSIGEDQVADGIKISRAAIKKITVLATVPLTLNVTPDEKD